MPFPLRQDACSKCRKSLRNVSTLLEGRSTCRLSRGSVRTTRGTLSSPAVLLSPIGRCVSTGRALVEDIEKMRGCPLSHSTLCRPVLSVRASHSVSVHPFLMLYFTGEPWRLPSRPWCSYITPPVIEQRPRDNGVDGNIPFIRYLVSAFPDMDRVCSPVGRFLCFEEGVFPPGMTRIVSPGWGPLFP